MMNRVAWLKVCTLVALLLALSAADAAARTISMAWDASPDPTVVGYRIYWSTQSGVYNDTDYVDVGNVLKWTGDIAGDQLYLAVRSYDADGNVGALSLEVGDTSAFWLSNPGNQSSETGRAVDLALTVQGAAVTYAAEGLPEGLDIDALSGHVFGVVTENVPLPAVQVVTARAVDATGRVSSVQFYWTIRTNHPPLLTIPDDQITFSGDAAALPIHADDLDGEILHYAASNLPPGLAIDAATGVISGSVARTASGLFTVSVAVSDGRLTTGGTFAWQILTGDTPTVDRVISERAVGSTVTTVPFSTAIADETLIAFVQAAQPTDAGSQTAVVSGGGLAWSLVSRANTQRGTAEIWSAHTAARLTNVAVTADVSIGGAFVAVTVVTFASADGVGASASAGAPAGAPAVSLTTTRAGSLVFGTGNDWDGSVPRTLPVGQDLVHEVLTDAGDTFWVQRFTSAIGAAGTPVTLIDTAPTDHQWNLAALEIRARAQTPPRVPTVALTPAVALPGTSLTAAIANAPGTPGDWAGLFGENAGPGGFVSRQFLNGSTVQLTFTAPAAPGAYNVRLFAAANPAAPIAVSNTIVVPASLSIDDVSMRETNSGSTSMIFTVGLAAPGTLPVTVNYATVDGTAKAGTDYTAQTGSLVFAPGVTRRTIAVTIFGDKIDEADESFSVKLSGATNAVIADALGVGTILDNDEAARVENQMFGFGALVDGRLRERFVFRVAERLKGDYARLEFWSSEPVKGKGVDDDDRAGSLDNDYRHDHKTAKNRFESTSVTSLVFGVRDRNGNQTVTFAGAGTWNGKAGYTFETQAADRGEPGRGRDTFTLIVKDSRGTVVLKVDGTIDEGNIQSTPNAKR